MAGKLIQVIPRTDFQFNLAAAAGTQRIVIGPRSINTVDFVGGVMTVLVHASSWASGSASASVDVRNNFFDPLDPTQQWLSAGTSLSVVAIANGTVGGTILQQIIVVPLTAPTGPSVQCSLNFTQGAAGGACNLTLSAYLLGRDSS